MKMKSCRISGVSFLLMANLLFCIVILLSGLSCQAEADAQEINPTEPIVPDNPSGREVGIAYSLMIDRDMWADADNTWGTPLVGKYDSRDRRVIRQHAQWLADAGVDFIWLDWSNNVIYDPDKLWNGGKQDLIEDATAILFDEYYKMSKEGLSHPRISIFIGVTGAKEAVSDGRLQKKADQVWNMYANNQKYKDLIQLYKGKPLLVVYVDTPSPWRDGTPEWNDDRFTVRWMTGFVSEQEWLRTEDRVSKYGYWSWEDRGEQTYTICDGQPESMVVCAATRPQFEPGESGYIPAVGRLNGETFRKQFARAREIGTHFAMVVSWNEWTCLEQLNAEVSKDLEPSVEYGYTYLEILKEEIQKFKSVE